MENINNCFSVYYNFTLTDKANRKQVKGNNSSLLLRTPKYLIHKTIKEHTARNLDDFGGKTLSPENTVVNVQLVSVLDFPDTEIPLWEEYKDKETTFFAEIYNLQV